MPGSRNPIPDGIARQRGRQAAAPERRDPGHREVQRGPGPGVQDSGDPPGQHDGAALPPQAGAQRLSVGDAAALQLPDRPARDAGGDADEALPAPAGRADALPVAARIDAGRQPVGPVAVHLHLRGAGGLALAGVLRDLARHRRVAAAGGEVKVGLPMMKWLLLALFVIAAIVIGPLTHEGWSAWPGAFAIVPGTFVLM